LVVLWGENINTVKDRPYTKEEKSKLIDLLRTEAQNSNTADVWFGSENREYIGTKN